VSTGALRIGGNNVWGEYFSGLIDEVRVYNRALSEAEIQSDMNLPIGAALSAAVAPVISAGNSHAITSEVLDELRTEAIARWESNGALSSSVEALHVVSVRVADLPGLQLGMATADTIWIDVDAAGHGWFVDGTPHDDSEFPSYQGSESFGRMDLLTALVHEYGHLLGQNHSEVSHAPMAENLAPGERRMPENSRRLSESASPILMGRDLNDRPRAIDTRDILFGAIQMFREIDRVPALAKWRWRR
jgi:hypothetical protein